MLQKYFVSFKCIKRFLKFFRSSIDIPLDSLYCPVAENKKTPTILSKCFLSIPIR